MERHLRTFVSGMRRRAWNISTSIQSKVDLMLLSGWALVSVAILLTAGCLHQIAEEKRSVQASASQQPSQPYQPIFHSRECFQHNGMREPWEPTTPDGIVVLRGYEKYLVMFREEAEKTGGGPKYGTPISFETLDSQFHSIECPKSWQDHTHEKSLHVSSHAF